MFHFKKFSLTDQNTPMKIGMDSVVLGSWVQEANYQFALDIGSGCGILSFMLAQRFHCEKIIGVEFNRFAFEDSLRNLAVFPLINNIHFIYQDFFSWETDINFDLIISNPPFFNESIRPLDSGRLAARFDSDWNTNLFIEKVVSVLNEHGKFTFIYDFKRFESINKTCLNHGLFLNRKTEIKNKPESLSKRVLLEYSFNNSASEYSILTYRDLEGSYTESYKKLTSEFYLNF